MPKRWTDKEDTLLRQLYELYEYVQLASMLDRSEPAVRNRCSLLKLEKHKALTQADKKIIQIWYTMHRGAPSDKFDLDNLAAQLGRSKNLICRYAKSIRLTSTNRRKSVEEKRRMSKRTKQQHRNNEHPRGMLGKHHTEGMKQRHSEIVKQAQSKISPERRKLIVDKAIKTKLQKYGTGNPAINSPKGNVYSRTKSGKRADLGGKFFRSAWEANYARYLNWLLSQGTIKSWEYEPQTFVFHGIKRGTLSYLPDFKVIMPDDSIEWHEVKGWMDDKSKTKLKRFAKYYPKEKLVLIDQRQYKSIAKWARIISEFWEG